MQTAAISRDSARVWKSADDWKAPVYDCSHVRNDPSDPKRGVVAKGGLGLTVLSDWVCPDPMKERHTNPEQDWKVECGRMGQLLGEECDAFKMLHENAAET